MVLNDAFLFCAHSKTNSHCVCGTHFILLALWWIVPLLVHVMCLTLSPYRHN